MWVMVMRFQTRTQALCFLFVLGSVATTACGAPDVSGSGYRLGAGDDDDDDDDSSKKKPGTGTGSGTGTGTGTETTTPSTTDTTGTNPTNPTTPTTPAILDADKDGIADDVDCAPNDAAIAGTKLALDDLTTDKQLFAPATGFGQNWSYTGGYVQTRLANAPDQTLLKKDATINEATVEVIAASTEISSGITPVLRQMFITFGTKIDGGFNAVGCGLEVDGSQTVTQKTTIARLNGGPTSVTSTPLDRVNRAAVQANEEFKIKGTLKNGLVTCEVTIKGTTTTAQANVGNTTGSIGFFTKQTKALFRQINACKLK